MADPPYKVEYMIYEQTPAIYLVGAGGRAWWFHKNGWSRAPDEFMQDGAMISKAEFDEFETEPFTQEMLDDIAGKNDLP